MQTLCRLVFVVVFLTSPTMAWAQNTQASGTVQGSFERPLRTVTTDQTELGGVLLGAFAGPFQLWGAFFGWVAPFEGDSIPSKLGYEIGFGGVTGGGEWDDPDLREWNLGRNIELGMTLATASGVIKARPIDSEENGWFGATGYVGVNAGFFQMQITNAYGTAYTSNLMLGATAGVAIDLSFKPYIGLDLFAGYRLNTYGREPVAPNATDPGEFMILKTPELGGNIHVYLPMGFTLDLATLLNWMNQRDDQQTAKVIQIGLTWNIDDPRKANDHE